MRAGGRRIPDGRLRPAALGRIAVAWLKVLLVALALAYVLFAALVWFAQEKLLFYPQPLHGAPSAPPGWTLEAVKIAAADGTPLAGVLVKPPASHAPLVIYFGGNAEEVTAFAPLAGQVYGERAALFVNYRGYGGSGGKPAEKDLVADAIGLYDWAARRTDVDAARVALHGRSLGTGVAVQVAAARPARCVVLTSPFDSARDVAQRGYPWLPVKLLLRHPFDSAALAPKMRMPVLILMGEADDLIPMSHSVRLAGLWGGPVERKAFPGFGHNDIGMNPAYEVAIREFLSRCQ